MVNYDSTKTAYWLDIVRAAQPQGTNTLRIALRELGNTLFESAAYAGRGRNNQEYVYDLYRTYLMREPENQEAWNFWTTACNTYGRAAVRAGFDESTEFQEKVGGKIEEPQFLRAVSLKGL